MCGYYMAIGMSYEDYWFASPHLVKYYRKAHRYRTEQRNQELWLQGLYIYNAVSTVISNAFGGKSGKKAKYLEKPIDIFPKKIEKSEEADNMRRNTFEVLSRFEEHFNKRKGGVKPSGS